MDRNKFERIRERIIIELKKSGIEDEFDIQIHGGNGTYGRNSVLKLNIDERGTDGVAVPKHVNDFYSYARKFGLMIEDLGAEFVSEGYRYVVTGIKPGAPKYPIIAKRNANGKEYVFPASSVRAALEVQRAGRQKQVEMERSANAPFS